MGKKTKAGLHQGQELLTGTGTRERSGILVWIGILLVWLAFISGAYGATDPYIVFKPIPPRTDSSVEKWTALGVSQAAAEALHQYAVDPRAATGLGVLQHYNDFAGDKNQAEKYAALRTACFQRDNQLFQSIDALKYEVVMRTQKRLSREFSKQGGIDGALRVGSSAARHREWLDWAEKGKDLNSMPTLDVNKQFSSDDDITNIPNAAAEEKNPVLGELLNGQTAAQAFIEESIEMGFINGLDPKLVQIEFLSPTKAYGILQIQHPGEFLPVKPMFMKNWTASDEEKYNGLFAVEQLHEWALKKGMITTDVNDPRGSTLSYAEFAKTHNDPNAPKGFTSHGLMAWMANNHRQIFKVHSGDLKSLAKYTTRMIAAWDVLKLPSSANDAAMFELAEKIYNPPENYTPPPDALDKLKEYNRALIVKAHTHNFSLIENRLIEAIKAGNPRRPTDRGLNFDGVEIQKLILTDPKLNQAVNSLAVAYSNIDEAMIQELEIEIGKKIKEAGDKRKPGTPQAEYAARMSAHLLQTLELAKKSAAASRVQTDAFVYLRKDLGEKINAHITDLSERLNLDTYLLKVATGDFSDTELRIDWDGNLPVVAKRQLTPEDVAQDMRMIESLSKLFHWKEESLARMAKEYFEVDDPGLAVRMVKLVREMGEVATAKPVTVTYKDADGKQVSKTMTVSKFKTGLNAGFLAFKAALAGWDLWGDAADGKTLFENLKKIATKSGMDPQELAIAHSQILANAINLSEYAKIPVPGGSYFSTLANMAGNSFTDDNLYTELGKVLFNDLTLAYQPHLAYAYAVHGIASWGWNKYSLYASRGEIFQLLLENGIWEYPDQGGKKDENGNTNPSGDSKTRSYKQDPVFKGYVEWDGKNHEATIPASNVTQLAKLLTDPVKDGIMLKKSKTKVDPRLSLMDIAYKGGYVAQDQMIDIDIKAITELFGGWSIFSWPSLISLPVLVSDSSYWTKGWLESVYGIQVPTPEDATVISGDKERLIQIGSGKKEGWGTWAATFVDGVRYGVLKNLGYLMQDFWVKRQILLEKVVLPAILAEAAKQKIKDDVQSADVSDYPDELQKLRERMMELDKRVWEKIARSADPFINVGYNPEKDIPITEQWWESIKPQRETLAKCINWLEKYKDDPDVDPKEEFPESYLNLVQSYYRAKSYLGYGVVVDTREDVPKLARYTIGDITDILIAHEKAYDGILRTLEDTRKLAQENGKMDIFPYHVHLKPLPLSWFGQLDTTNDSEKVSDPSSVASIADDWQGKYKEESMKVSADICAILISMGFKPPQIPESAYDMTQPAGKIMTALYNWWSSNGDIQLVPNHPLWKDGVQLRMQIHKLQNMLVKPEELSKDEFNKVVSQMVFKEVRKDEDASLTKDTLTDVPVKVTAGKPMERGGQIQELVTQMEQDYQDILDLVQNLFDVTLEVSPASGYYIPSEIQVKVSATPKLQGLGTGDLLNQVENYRFEIYSLEPSVNVGGLIVNEVVRENTWAHHLSASGKQKIKVQLLGTDHLPLSVTEHELTAGTAWLDGELIVHSNVTLTQPATIFFGRESQVRHVAGEVNQPVKFHLEIKRVNDELVNPPQDPSQESSPGKPMSAQAMILPQVDPAQRTPGNMTIVTSNKAEIQVNKNIFSILTPLEIQKAVPVTIQVNVTDASGSPVTSDITASSGMNSVSTPNELILQLKSQDQVSVKAERKDPAPGISATSAAISYDFVTMGNEMSFDLQLDYYDVGHLTVEGRFVPAPGIDPAPVFSTGQMRSNISQEQQVGPDGSFSFTNTRAVLLSKALMIYGVMFSDDGRIFKPKGGAFQVPLTSGKTMNLGTIELEPWEVTVKPVTVSVLDKSGNPLTQDMVTVRLGSTPATWDGKYFSGPWTIKSKNDELEIKVELTLFDGFKVQGETILSTTGIDLLKSVPHPPPPVLVYLDVHLGMRVEGSTTIVLDREKEKPNGVKLEFPGVGETALVGMEEPFSVLVVGPVAINQKLDVEARAKNLVDKILYRGSASGTVPDTPVLDVGKLTLEKDTTGDFLSIGTMQVTGAGTPKPVLGSPMKGSAEILVGKYEGPVSVEWTRQSDMHVEKAFKDYLSPGQSVPLRITMPEVPKAMRTQDDVLEIRISDEIDQEAVKSFPFTWESGDEFLGFQFFSVKKQKRGTKFGIGEEISTSGTWQIAKDSGTSRTLVYSVGGTEFFREDVTVPKGSSFTHSAILDTQGLSPGMTEVKAEMINNDPVSLATGAGKVRLAEAEDRILSAGAGSSAGAASSSRNFTQGDSVFINAEIQAAEGKDGVRSLTLKYRGQVILSESLDLKGDETASRSFQINSDKLSAKNHSFTLELFDEQGKRQDYEAVWIKLAEKQQSQGANAGGLQNVSCTGDTINIKVWDHSSQDGDIITLTLGGRVVLSGFNMGWDKNNIVGCGGSEPFGPPCAFFDLPLPAGTSVPVSVTAHNQGDGGPNTAALKVEGGCTPELQYWNLQTGETSSIYISRGSAAETQNDQGNASDTSSSTGQSSILSWP